MRIIVVGAGPVGSLTALMLARRGHQVALVDRDPGPGRDGPWRRRGVMQFDLPHFFRPLVRQTLCEEVPELWSAVLLAGGLPALPAGFPAELTGLQSRRATFERAIWTFTNAEPGVVRLTGHADRLVLDRDEATGVIVDGAALEADAVVIATGRTGQFADQLRAPGDVVNCGFSYAARQYRALPGVAGPDWGMPRRYVYDGYEAIVMPQDAETLSALIVRPSADRRLADLRHNTAFAAAAAAVPLLAEWTDPQRFEPISDVRAGHNLVNAYRSQRRPDGTVTSGALFIGDSVLTTNPAAGRGVALGLQQARKLVELLDTSTDLVEVATLFDEWCEQTMRPWYDDHVYWDRTELQRFAGQDLDLQQRIPSDVVCECAELDPSIMDAARAYLTMRAGPRILDTVQDEARAVLRTGWRPAYAQGPSRDELIEHALAATA